MTPNDVDQFEEQFTQLMAYFPYCKIDKDAVLEGYFLACMPLPLDAIPRLFSRVIQECRYFPTVHEVLTLAQTLFPSKRSAAACPRCPSGHGKHEGHNVSHYPAGPYCNTCNADMPTPKGYLTMPPVGSSRTSQAEPVAQLPEYSQTPLRREEVRELIQGVMDVLDKKHERLRGMADWRPLSDAEQLAKRREELRQQAREMTDEAN